MNTIPCTGFPLARARKTGAFLLLGLLLSTWLVGCVAPPATTPAAAPIVTPSPTSTGAAPGPAAPPTAAPPASAEPDGAVTLTWWTPEFISQQAPQPGGQVLMEHLAEFERLHNGQIRVHTELKARYGRGGLLDLMRNAQNVAPGILPDIVTLDVIELEQAQAAGLLQPLGAALPEATLTGLYPFARSAGEFQGQLWAVQYLADFEHVVYRAEAFQAAPQTWNDLLGPETTPFLFTLGAPQASATTSRFKGLQYTVLSQYLSAGPTVDAANRLPALEEGPLLRLLEFYKAAADAGLLPPNALEVGDVDTIWDVFLQGRVPMVQVSARQYLTGREMLTSARYAATPGWSGPATPIAGGWALAVVTTDATRQRAAFELMAHLLQPENAGPFAASIGWLPTSAAALQTWGSAPYYEFVDAELASAASYPAGSAFSQTAARLQGAITAVLSEGVSPQDAVLAALAQPR